MNPAWWALFPPGASHLVSGAWKHPLLLTNRDTLFSHQRRYPFIHPSVQFLGDVVRQLYDRCEIRAIVFLPLVCAFPRTVDELVESYASNPPQQGISARVILKNFTFPVGMFRRNVTGNKVTLAPVRGASCAGVFRVALWCAMYLVRGCALVGSLAIQTYSLTRFPFVIKIISVNGSESVGPVVQKCRSTWQDRVRVV